LILLVNLALRSKFSRPLNVNHVGCDGMMPALNMLAFIAILVVFVVIDRRRERRRRAELASILRGVIWLIQRSPDAWRIVLQLCADADSLRAAVRTAH
jgi:cyanate permease